MGPSMFAAHIASGLRSDRASTQQDPAASDTGARAATSAMGIDPTRSQMTPHPTASSTARYFELEMTMTEPASSVNGYEANDNSNTDEDDELPPLFIPSEDFNDINYDAESESESGAEFYARRIAEDRERILEEAQSRSQEEREMEGHNRVVGLAGRSGVVNHNETTYLKKTLIDKHFCPSVAASVWRKYLRWLSDNINTGMEAPRRIPYIPIPQVIYPQSAGHNPCRPDKLHPLFNIAITVVEAKTKQTGGASLRWQGNDEWNWRAGMKGAGIKRAVIDNWVRRAKNETDREAHNLMTSNSVQGLVIMMLEIDFMRFEVFGAHYFGDRDFPETFLEMPSFLLALLLPGREKFYEKYFQMKRYGIPASTDSDEDEDEDGDGDENEA